MDVKLPNLGEGADTGTVVGILVKPGAQIKKGQNIIELETGKAVAPIPSPAAGTVTNIRVKEGDKLSVGGVILSLDEAAGGAGPTTALPAAAPAKKTAPKVAKKAAPAAEPEAEEESDNEATESEVVNENPVAPPSVRRVARELNIDLHKIPGEEGRVSWEDLRNYIARLERIAAQKKAAKPGAAAAPAEIVDFSQWGSIYKRPVTPLRKVIAQRMTESRQIIPEVTQFDEADVTALNDLRKKLAPDYEKKGARLTLTSFVLKAVATTLEEAPQLSTRALTKSPTRLCSRSIFTSGSRWTQKPACSYPSYGMCDKKDLVQLSKDIADVATKARDRKLGLDEMRGGTFTISNQGRNRRRPLHSDHQPPRGGHPGLGPQRFETGSARREN